MFLPEALVAQAKKRIAAFPVEGFVLGQGPTCAEIMLVGEAPGETEITTGVPFSGRAGKELMGFLKRLGLTRDDVYITSAFRSRPYRFRDKKLPDGAIIRRKANRPPTQKEVLAHAALLDYEISHIDAAIMVTLGNVGLRRLIGPGVKIMDVHGKLIVQPVRRLKNFSKGQYEWTDQAYSVFPMFHPASIFYNRKLLDLIHKDLDTLRSYLSQ
ncbi:uracil-DNA glycosylase [Sporolactobacillus sp. THM7-4]|nr:uracil-DNA glycosylase [Sporolactobacillus sp. THM7-4]